MKFAELTLQVERKQADQESNCSPSRTQDFSFSGTPGSGCQRDVCQDAIQIHGGMGYSWESDVQLFAKRDARCGCFDLYLTEFRLTGLAKNPA